MVPPMVSKPKLSGTDVKKHRMTELRSSNSFADLFGNPMTLPAKVSPENKRALTDKIVSSKSFPDKSEKLEKPPKLKHSLHKERKKDKCAEDRNDKKDRALTKEKDRVKEKLKRPQSPADKEEFPYAASKKSSLPSPTKKQPVPSLPLAIQRPPSPKPKEKDHKKASTEKEKDRVKENFKVPNEDRKFDRKKKKHKEDKSKERKEKDKETDHDKNKDSTKKSEKKIVKPEKHEKTDKHKNSEYKSPKDDRKSPKYAKERDKVKIEKSDRNETVDKAKDSRPDKEKQKHKHKRKDKKDRADEPPEKEKQEKQKVSEKKNAYTTSPPVNPLSTLLAEMPERDSSDSTHSVDDDSVSLVKSCLTPKEESEIVTNPVLSSDSSKPLSPRTTADIKNEGDEKSRKDKSKVSRAEERECRKRKRKLDSEQDELTVKRDRGHSISPSIEPVSSSQSPISIDVDSCYTLKETASSHIGIHNITENEQVAPDSTNSAFIEPEAEGGLVFSEDYVSQLKELQQKIMTLQDNQELQRVVQVIAETGQYEVTRKTFDFDLCALDRATVQRLQQFFSAS